ncbi:MAG TPA: GNAT family N-acetyltransferase [Myxococcota bacterium]|nr:GNAT family N-acetyltransferase [Myxococcota bacterium]
MRSYLFRTIFLALVLSSCGDDAQQQQPTHKTEPEQPGKLLVETINSFSADNMRYNDVLNLRDDCFQTKSPAELLGGKLFIATIDNKTVGYFGYYLSDKHTAFIHDVCVGSPYRGSGVGTKLFKQGLAIIEANPEITELELHVDPNNGAAVKLYKSAGFVRWGGSIEQDGHHDFMKKTLPKPN